MKIEKVENCFCGEMPVILVHNCIGCVEYCVKCFKCGRGGNWYPTCFSTYKAIKHWNNFQKELKGTKSEAEQALKRLEGKDDN